MVKARARNVLTFLFVSILLACSGKEVNAIQEPIVLPELHIQPEHYKLGDVKEGDRAVATFFVRNNSAQVIELIDIQASCGCTSAEPDSYLIQPGGFTTLKVVVDTTAKQMNIKKSIHVRDSLGHEAHAILTFNVIDNPHAFPKKGSVTGIFDGKCASCHFEPLLDIQQGEAIYKTGCAMCHGESAAGAYAMSLRGYTSLEGLREGIAKGSGRAQMPGFAKEHGGPLSSEQIDALAKWLMSLPAETVY